MIADEIKPIVRVASVCAQPYTTHFFGKALYFGYTVQSAWLQEAIAAAGLCPAACIQIEHRLKEYRARRYNTR